MLILYHDGRLGESKARFWVISRHPKTEKLHVYFFYFDGRLDMGKAPF